MTFNDIFVICRLFAINTSTTIVWKTCPSPNRLMFVQSLHIDFYLYTWHILALHLSKTSILHWHLGNRGTYQLVYNESFYGCFQKIGGKPPKWMVKIMENPMKMDDLGGVFPLFSGCHPYKRPAKWISEIWVAPTYLEWWMLVPATWVGWVGYWVGHWKVWNTVHLETKRTRFILLWSQCRM